MLLIALLFPRAITPAPHRSLTTTTTSVLRDTGALNHLMTPKPTGVPGRLSVSTKWESVKTPVENVPRGTSAHRRMVFLSFAQEVTTALKMSSSPSRAPLVHLDLEKVLLLKKTASFATVVGTARSMASLSLTVFAIRLTTVSTNL